MISRRTFDLNVDENHKENKTSEAVIEPIKTEPIKTERFFEDHVIYFDNKIKKEEGRYKIMEGGKKVKDGKWLTWYKNGNKKTEENYKEEWGLPEKRGKWISWHQDGVKKSEGYFVNNLEQGIFKKWNSEGVLISETPYKDGIPTYYNEKKSGDLISTDKKLDEYKGDYENGLKSGKGKMIYKNGDIYEGEWKADKKNGKGKLIYSNGNIYTGTWESGKKHGKGTLRLKNNITFEQNYENGRIIN